MALGLARVAGFVDAIGYLPLGQIFTANMTGNTVLLGIENARSFNGGAARVVVAGESTGGGVAIAASMLARQRAAGATRGRDLPDRGDRRTRRSPRLARLPPTTIIADEVDFLRGKGRPWPSDCARCSPPAPRKERAQGTGAG